MPLILLVDILTQSVPTALCDYRSYHAPPSRDVDYQAVRPKVGYGSFEVPSRIPMSKDPSGQQWVGAELPNPKWTDYL